MDGTAMDPTNVITVDKLFANYGVSGTLIVLLVWALVKYGPRLIEAHIAFVQAVQAQGLQISQRQTKHAQQTQQALDVMVHACDVIDTFARGSAHEGEIKAHVDAMRHVLSDRGQPRDATA